MPKEVGDDLYFEKFSFMVLIFPHKSANEKI